MSEQIPSETTRTDQGVRRPGVANHASFPSKSELRGGWIVSGLAVLFLIVDAGFKVLALPAAVKGTADLGYPESAVFTIGFIEVVCLIVYLIPRTSLLGAILWTGYLGGAVATHVRVESPLLTHTLFPTYVAALLWVGLWLRDPRLRALLPIRTPR